MEFQQLTARALEIRKKYAQFEMEQYGRTWTTEELTLGFMKDLGDLAKLVQAKRGIRHVENVDSEIEHELSDCLWSVIVLAGELNVDLEAAFLRTMDQLESRFQEQ